MEAEVSEGVGAVGEAGLPNAGDDDVVRGHGVADWNCDDAVIPVGGSRADGLRNHGVPHALVHQGQYKTAVAELHKWYQEGLIDPESFAHDDKTYLAKGKASVETLGSYVWWETEEAVGADRAKNYMVMPVLKGTDGKQIASVSNAADISRGAFAITRANKYPAATMRWVCGPTRTAPPARCGTC